MNNNNLKYWLIIPVCAIVLLLGGTYAWYVWQTSQDEETIIATDTGYAQVFFDGGSDVNGKLKPVSDKSKGMSKEITVIADKAFIEPISFNLYLDINSIDENLKHESFKFELYKDGNLVKAGNFGTDYLTGALSECSKNEGVNHITLTNDVVTTTEAVYTLYTWIDGNMSNPIGMEGKDFDFTLHADGQHAILGETPTIPEGATYIRGAIPGTPNNHDMTNATVYNAGDNFPASPQKGDIYQYEDFEYVYGYYLNNTSVSTYAEGISYNDNNIAVSNLAISNQYNKKVLEENVSEFIFDLRGGYTKVVWKSAEGKFDDVEGWGVGLNNYSGFVGSLGEVLTEINGSFVINMSGTFSDTVFGAPITIPETVKYIEHMFTGSNMADLTTSILRVKSNNITSVEGLFYNSYPYRILIPANSTTYNTFMNANLPENVVITATYELENGSIDSLVHNDIIPNGGIYVSGSAVYTAGQSFPETLSEGDLYQFGDYIYRYRATSWDIIPLDNTKESYGPILKTINNVNIDSSLTKMFNGFKNLVTAPDVPDLVTSIYYMFNSCTSLTGTIRINSENVSDVSNAFDNTGKPITVEVPSGSTTYETFMTAKENGKIPENVTITTFVKE